MTRNHSAFRVAMAVLGFKLRRYTTLTFCKMMCVADEQHRRPQTTKRLDLQHSTKIFVVIHIFLCSSISHLSNVVSTIYGQHKLQPSLRFSTLTEVFPCLFLSRKANARVWFAKTVHGPHSSQLVNCVVLCIVCV